MSDKNETTDLISEYCGELLWMCEQFAQVLLDLSEDRNQNMSEVLTSVNKKGMFTKFCP